MTDTNRNKDESLQPAHGEILPERIKGLSTSAKLVYAYLNGHRVKTRQQIAEALGLSERGVRNALASLDEAGVLDIRVEEHKRGQPIYYTTK